MAELFAPGDIGIFEGQFDWPGAVRACGGLLLRSGAAGPEYIENMVRAVETLGPYIVVVPHIALAHAAPGPGVFRDGLCLCLFREPVIFGSENDPVHIVIGMCAASKDGHLAQFEPLADILDDPGLCGALLSCGSAGEIYEYLKKI